MDRRQLGAEALDRFWLVLGGYGAAVLAAAFLPDTNLGIGLVGVSLALARPSSRRPTQSGTSPASIPTRR